MELDELKNYMKVDYSEDDNLINSLYKAACQYIVNAISAEANVEDFADDEIFDRASVLLTAHWFANRLATVQTNTMSSVSQSEILFGVLPLLNQLRGAYWLKKEREANDHT